MSRISVACLLTLDLSVSNLSAAEKDSGCVSIFDGKSMKGWKANENTETWKFEDGNLGCHGPRSHLFYMGDKKPFVNFEFKAEVMILN